MSLKDRTIGWSKEPTYGAESKCLHSCSDFLIEGLEFPGLVGEAEKAGPLRLVDMRGTPLLHASHSRWAPYFSPHSLEYCHPHCVDVSTTWAHSDMLRTVQVSY